MVITRRSHSQDVFAVSDLSPTHLQDAFSAWAQQDEAQRIQTVEEHPDEAEETAPYERFSHTPSSAHIRTVPMPDSDDEDDQKQEMTCINALDDEPDDEDAPRRRGKKRKKSKQAITTTFTASQEPETHITTLGPDDTPLHSHRPSFSFSHGGGSIQPPACQTRAAYEIVETDNSNFFLDEEALKLLRRGLNIDIVEEVFDRYVSNVTQKIVELCKMLNYINPPV